jgi:two-component system CheB/CheR fusion protein
LLSPSIGLTNHAGRPCEQGGALQLDGRVEHEAQSARAYAEAIVESVGVALLVIDEQLQVVSSNRAFNDMFGTSAKVVVGESITSVLGGAFDDGNVSERLRELFRDSVESQSIALRREFPRIGLKNLRLSARRMPSDDRHRPLILLATEELS